MVKRVQKGNEFAFSELLNNHELQLYYVAFKYAGNKEAAVAASLFFDIKPGVEKIS